MKKKISQKIIELIAQNKIKPRGRWQFILKDILLWLSAVLSLLFSAISFSLMIFIIKNINTGFRPESQVNSFQILLVSLPYFWIFFVSAFIYIIYRQVKHTKKGYLYSLGKIIVSSVIISIAVGYLFSSLGWAESLDEELSYRAPFYSQIINPQLDFWSQPEEGRLAGIIISSDKNNWNLLDKEGRNWEIIFLNNDVRKQFPNNMPIRLIGEKIDNNKFLAYRVMSLAPGKGMFQRHLNDKMRNPRHMPQNNNLEQTII